MKVKETKVYQLFACLSAQEQKDFSRFLATHSKDKKEALRKSLRFLCAVAGDMAVDDRWEPTIQDWWKEVYTEDFLPRGMNKHQHAMIADLEAFLVDRKLRKEADVQLAGLRKCEQMILLLNSLAERGQDRLFEKYSRKADKLLSSLPQEGEYYGLRYKLGLLLIAHKQKGKHAHDKDFVQVKRDLDRYYSLHTLYLAQGVGAKNLKEDPFNRLFDLSCVTQLIGNDTEPSPLADLMLDFLTLADDYSIVEWYTLHDRLRDYQDFQVVPRHIWLDLANSLFSMASRRISTGQLEYYEAALQFYQLIHDAGILPQVFREAPNHWRNLKMISNECGDHSLYNLCKVIDPNRVADPLDEAHDLYTKGDFAGARVKFFRIYSLATNDEKNIRNVAGGYVIRCDYEQLGGPEGMKRRDELKAFVQTFRNQLNSGKKQHKPRYIEFLKAVGELMKLRFHKAGASRSGKLKKLREKVATTSEIISRKWLLEKIDELL